MPAQKYNIKKATVTENITASSVVTITHNMGRVARQATFKRGGVEDIEFVWNDKGGSTTQIDIDNTLGGLENNVEINLIGW